jgi:predicted lipid-binding transport protein (Tim44 family)
MYPYARLTGNPRPTRDEWFSAGLIGILLLSIANGGMTVALQFQTKEQLRFLFGAWLQLLIFCFETFITIVLIDKNFPQLWISNTDYSMLVASC